MTSFKHVQAVAAVVSFCLLLSAAASGAAEFKSRWGHPRPQGQPVFGLAFVDDLEGWAVTRGGAILHTDDAAQSWTIAVDHDEISDDLYDVVVADDGTLFVCGDGLLRSTDGGDTWTALSHPGGELRDLCTIPGGGVSAAGVDGHVVVSFDGGDTWSEAGPLTGDARHHLWRSALEGYVVGQYVSHRTVDGGATWTEMFSGGFDGFNGIFEIDATTLAVFADFDLWLSEDGGETWAVPSGRSVPTYAHRAVILSPTHWVIAANGEGDEIFETFDAGANWDAVNLFNDVGFLAFEQLPSGRVVAANDVGDIYWSDDLGHTLSNGTLDLSQGRHAGRIDKLWRKPGGRLNAWGVPEIFGFESRYLQSDDGGLSWVQVPAPATISLESMAWLDDDRGVAGGYNSVAFTTDGGATWQLGDLEPGGLVRRVAVPAADRYFAAATTGGGAGAGGSLYRSVDGGATWTEVGGGLPVGDYDGWCVFFAADGQTGFVGGRVSGDWETYRTIDGGATWSPMTGMAGLFDVHELGGGVFVAVAFDGTFRSTDSGVTWDQVSDTTLQYDVHFSDALNGMAWGNRSYYSITEDGGLTWETMESPYHSPNPGQTSYTSVWAATYSDEGWVIGGAGYRIAVLSEISSTAIEDEAPAGATPSAVRIERVHPNPFNPSTTVRFSTATAGQVRVTIHDLAGRRIRTLVDGVRASGEHAAVWRGDDERGRTVAAGVYFAMVKSAAGTATAKLALVK